MQKNDPSKEVCIIPLIEFFPRAGLTVSKGLLLNALPLQDRDSMHNSSTYTKPATLGCRTKDSMIVKISYPSDMNEKEDLSMPFKVYSKNIALMFRFLLLKFISADQLEKRSHALFSGRNKKHGATYSLSCNCKDRKDKSIPCKGCLKN